MATFDAGSIEARLTLDRSAFQAELAAARREAEQFEGSEYTANIGVEADSAALDRLRQQLASLSDEQVNVTVDVDPGALAALRAQLASLADETVNVNVDLDEASLRAVQRRLDSLGGTANIFARVIMENGPDTSDQRMTIRADVEADEGQLRALLARVEAMRPTVNVRVDVDDASLEALRAQLATLRDGEIDVRINIPNRVVLASLRKQLQDLNPYEIRIDLDITQALAQLNILEYALLFAKTLTHFNIDLDTSMAMAQLAALEALLLGIQTTAAIPMNISVNSSSVSQAGGRVGLFMIAIKAAIALSPILVASLGSITAVVAGTAAALVGAGGALGVFALGVAGAIKRFKDIEDPLRSTNPAVHELAHALGTLSAAWNRFIDGAQDQVFTLAAQGATVLVSVLDRIGPIFDAMVPVISNALRVVNEFVQSAEGARMFDYFRIFGTEAFRSILDIGGNLLLFFGRLFEAFAPFASMMLSGLNQIVAKWAEWADGLGQTQGFLDFIAYVSDVGPRVLDMLGSLFDALINIGVALAPFAGPMADGLRIIFDIIAGIDPSILGAIAVAIGSIVVATTAWSVAMGILNAVLALNPFVAIGMAVLGLAAALIYLWNTNEGFRNAVIGTWTAIKAAWTVAITTIQVLWEKFKTTISTGATTLMTNIRNAFSILGSMLSSIWSRAVAAVVGLWNGFKSTLTSGAQNIMANIRGALSILGNILSAIWRGAISTVTGLWNAFKTTVTNIARAVLDGIRNALSSLSNTVSSIFQSAVSSVQGIWSRLTGVVTSTAQAAMNGIRGILNGLSGFISGVFNAAVGAARSAWGQFSGAVQAGTDRAMGIIRGIPGAIRGALGNLGGLLVGAGRSIIDGLVSGIQGAIGRVRAVLNSVTNMIPSWKGPKQKDLKLLIPTGGWLMQGLVEGVERATPQVEKAFGSVTERLGSMPLSVQPSVAVQAPPRSMADYAGMPPAELDRVIESLTEQTDTLVRELRRMNGDTMMAIRKGVM